MTDIDSYEEGRRAFEEGCAVTENPYRHFGEGGNWSEVDWAQGWNDAADEMLKRQCEEDERRATASAVKGAGRVLRQIRRANE